MTDAASLAATEGRWMDQTAVVTGARGGIGSAVVAALAEAGVRVSASDIDQPPLGTSADRVLHARVDVTDSTQVRQWIVDVARSWGAPTIAVIAAGVATPGRLAQMDDDSWRRTMAVNLDGAYFTARETIRAMRSSGRGGRIVVLGSWAAAVPHPHIGAYSPSKAAVRSLVQTLALDHARDGILINEVAPGVVRAGMSRELLDADPQLNDRTRAAIPSGSLLEVADVVRDVMFLVSPSNRATTGAVLTSDGGLSLGSTMTSHQ